MSVLLLLAAFLVPPLYLLLFDLRDPNRSRPYKIIIGTLTGIILLTMVLIFLIWSDGTGGLASSIAAGLIAMWVVQMIVLPVSAVVWLLFAFSLAKRLTQKPQVILKPITHINSQTGLISILFIFLILTTIYFGWQNRTANLFKFDLSQVLRALSPFTISTVQKKEGRPADPSTAEKISQPLSLYTNRKLNFAFSYPESLNLYHVNEEKETDNLLRVFFESKEKDEMAPQDNQRNSNQQLFQGFMGIMPGFFGDYFNRDTRPVVYNLTFYIKSKSRSQSLYDVSQAVKEEFCNDESFTLTELKPKTLTGLKISCGLRNLYLLPNLYQPRQFFILTSRLSSLLPSGSEVQKTAELENASQVIIQSLTYLEPLENWTKYENRIQGYSYLHPQNWKNREICPNTGSNIEEPSPSSQTSPSAQTKAPDCAQLQLSQIVSPGYFSQIDKALFMVETDTPSCSIIKGDAPKIFLDGHGTEVEENNGEKIISLKANNRCYQITLQVRAGSPLRSVLDQILSTLKFL